MKLLFKQRMFSWFDSYDIYDENENTVYVVKGQLSWGHCLKIFDTEENELGTVKQEVLTWLPKFELYEGENYIGCLEKELGWFKPTYNIDFNGWHVEGDFPCWVSVKQFSKNDTATACQDWLRSTRLGRGSIKSHVRTVKVLGMGLFAFQERIHLWKGVTH